MPSLRRKSLVLMDMLRPLTQRGILSPDVGGNIVAVYKENGDVDHVINELFKLETTNYDLVDAIADKIKITFGQN